MKRLFVFILIVFCLALTSCNVGHIADTNGDEDTSLSTLTKEDIFTYRNSVSFGTVSKSSNQEFSLTCKKLSGNYLVKTITPNGRNLGITVASTVTKGNAYIVLMQDGRVVKEMENGEESVYITGNTKSEIELRVLGESCEFEIKVYISNLDN